MRNLTTFVCCIPSAVLALLLGGSLYYFYAEINPLVQETEENLERAEELVIELERYREIDAQVEQGVDRALDRELERWRENCPDPERLEQRLEDYQDTLDSSLPF